MLILQQDMVFVCNTKINIMNVNSISSFYSNSFNVLVDKKSQNMYTLQQMQIANKGVFDSPTYIFLFSFISLISFEFCYVFQQEKKL